MLYVIPLSKRDPACWRPAWGGVRLCGNDWWERLIFGEWCRFAQDDTVGYRGVVQNLFGWKYSSVKLIDTAFVWCEIIRCCEVPHNASLSHHTSRNLSTEPVR